MDTSSEKEQSRYQTVRSEIVQRHKMHWTTSHSRLASILAICLFFLSISANYLAESYASEQASNFVTDIVLSNTPVIDVDALYVYGALAIIVFSLLVVFANPKRIPFAFQSFTLFYFTRAFFITLTHLAPYPLHAAIDFGAVATRIIFGGGLFFSGHVGAPFLLALLFWKEKTLRYIFIGCSVFMAVVALLGHIHYTIDVVAAYFITYTIFHISETLFKKGYALFHSEPELEASAK